MDERLLLSDGFLAKILMRRLSSEFLCLLKLGIILYICQSIMLELILTEKRVRINLKQIFIL